MKRRTETASSGNEGFTLLETIIAMAIMVIAFGSILSIESMSLDTTLKAKQMSTVAMLARGKMSELEQEIENKKFEEVRPETSFEPFPEPFKEYSWKREIKEIEFPNISASLGAGAGAAGGGETADGAESGAEGSGATGAGAEQVTKLVSNFLSKAIREVKLTLKWKKGGHEREYTVSMYWVDLNHEFQLSL